MKINKHNLLYQDRDTWKQRVQTLKAFRVPHEAEILECELEYTKLICDYDGNPIMQDRFGLDMDWFLKLYSLKYKTKLRIFPA